MANRPSRTPEKDDAFFNDLEKHGIVIDAAKIAGYKRRSLYEWRKADTEFAQRWDDAIECAIQVLEREADVRGRDGVEEALYHAGKPVMVKDADGKEVHATVRKKSDVLLIFRLKALRPEVYRERIDAKGEINVTFGLADRLHAARLRTRKPESE